MVNRKRPRWATLEVAGKYADRHPVTLRRWIEAGRLPGYRNGLRVIEVDLNDLDDMVRTRLPASGSGAA